MRKVRVADFEIELFAVRILRICAAVGIALARLVPLEVRAEALSLKLTDLLRRRGGCVDHRQLAGPVRELEDVDAELRLLALAPHGDHVLEAVALRTLFRSLDDDPRLLELREAFLLVDEVPRDGLVPLVHRAWALWAERLLEERRRVRALLLDGEER